MKFTAYNNKGRLTWFGLPMWGETCLGVFIGTIIMSMVFLGCAPSSATRQSTVIGGKYRVVQVYGGDHNGTSFKAYYTDDVKYDGPWVSFYDKNGKQWIRVSGTVLVEGGER